MSTKCYPQISHRLSTGVLSPPGCGNTAGGEEMANAVDVAQYIFDNLGKWVDAWTIQKLTYYSKAWSLAWDGDPLFTEQFEAWPDGPVSRDLYTVVKHRTAPMSKELPDADPSKLTDRQRAVIDSVLEFYGHMSRDELIARTHAEAPWLEARGDLPPQQPSRAPLNESTIRRTYTLQSRTELETPKAPTNVAPEGTIIPDDVIKAQMQKWASTLEWLASR